MKGAKAARTGLLALLTATALTGVAASAHAEDLSYNSKYASIVVDAQSGEVLYAARADSARYPASLTKIMTLYMVFDALARGDLKPTDTITVSSRAASQAPVKVYLKAGDTIDVDTAMRLAAMYSANDMAEALAEKVGGSEERFAAMMTIKAKELGMTQTNFVNANGLPDARQLSSARDLAILARAVMRDYPQYYSYFDLNSITYRGRTYYNHNPLHGMPGVDGMKTGYTNAAGQNLVASQVKNGHRLIAVMLGAADKQQRREHVTELLSVGFDVIDRRAHGETILVAQNEFARAMDMPARGPSSPQAYTQFAQNDAQFSDQELRDTLEGSEQANATDVDVQKASAQVKAPLVVQTLTQLPPATTQAAPVDTSVQPAGPIPYAAVKAAIQPPSYAPVVADADTAKPVKTAVVAAKPPVNKSEANLAAAVQANRKQLAFAAPSKADDSDDNDDDAKPAKGKAAKAKGKKKNPDAVWSIQVGAFKEKSLANNWVKNVKTRFDEALAEGTSEVSKNENGWYRTRFAALTKEQATKACKSMTAKRLDCMVIKPDA